MRRRKNNVLPFEPKAPASAGGSAAEVPVLILAGGKGTRILEETRIRPKPLVEIGGLPILLHVVRLYLRHGFRHFVVCTGHRGSQIEKVVVEFSRGAEGRDLRARIQVIDTGEDTMTGGRVFRALRELRKRTPYSHFALTYADGLTDADLGEELRFHLAHRALGTVLGVPKPARFGEIRVVGANVVESFSEKPLRKDQFLSGGFFFFRREFEAYLRAGADLVLEEETLPRLAADGELRAFVHPGFWHPMDTLRDKLHLQELWSEGTAPWVEAASTTASRKKRK